jgi:hypothetical protein
METKPKSNRRVRRRLPTTLFASAAMAALVAAGCGGSADGGGVSASSEHEGFLQFAECMRDHGFDVPDPQPGSGGNLHVAPDNDIGQTDPGFRATAETCQSQIPGFEAKASSATEQIPTGAYDFAECMREHGLDFPDPVIEDGGIRIGPEAGTVDPDEGPPSDHVLFQQAEEDCRHFLADPPDASATGSDGSAP